MIVDRKGIERKFGFGPLARPAPGSSFLLPALRRIAGGMLQELAAAVARI